MGAEASLWSFIANAGFVVKLVMFILLLASIASWTIIVQRFLLFKQTKASTQSFEKNFWSGIELQQLSTQLKERAQSLTGIAHIFQSGLNEFTRLRQQKHIDPDAVMEGTQRAMRVAEGREIESLEKQLSFLATVGSVSPYVGLFGTVWGIMTSFRALGTVQQATISMVAPGISEALIATAIGLFAAIPAVVAYNRFSNSLDSITNKYMRFEDEFSNILHRQAHQQNDAAPQEA